MDGVMQVPTLFWFGISDSGLSIFAWVGFGLSLVVLGGYANAILLAVLWAMYMSIVHIGQIWYGYGWEIQLLETGFLSIFLCPLIDGRPFPRCRPPILVFWLDQATWRLLLARPYLPLLSLRNAADPQPDQSLFTFRPPLVSQIRYRLESFYRTGRAMVLIRSTHREAHRRCLARQF